MKDTFAVAIGSAAGQGVAIPGNIFTKNFARRGLHIFAYNANQSIIRGGHTFLTCVQSKLHDIVKSATYAPRPQACRGHVAACYNDQFVAKLALSILAAARVLFRSRSHTALEVLTLRQQVAVLFRPALVDHPAPHLVPLDRRPLHRKTRDRRRLASGGFSSLLALALSQSASAPTDIASLGRVGILEKFLANVLAAQRSGGSKARGEFR